MKVEVRFLQESAALLNPDAFGRYLEKRLKEIKPKGDGDNRRAVRQLFKSFRSYEGKIKGYKPEFLVVGIDEDSLMDGRTQEWFVMAGVSSLGRGHHKETGSPRVVFSCFSWSREGVLNYKDIVQGGTFFIGTTPEETIQEKIKDMRTMMRKVSNIKSLNTFLNYIVDNRQDFII